MRRAWVVRLLCLVGVVWTASGAALAMVVLPADLAEMVAQSPRIVHGRVVAVRAQTMGDRRAIESVVTLAVLASLKGEPSETVVLRVPGGQVGRYRRVMVGAPEFEAGDEVIVFLAGRGPVVPMPFGLSQGVYRVTRDRDRALVVTPPLVERAAGDGGVRVVRGDLARRTLPVDEFTRRVRSMVEDSGAVGDAGRVVRGGAERGR
jgi:hypothetical protein